MTGIPVVHVGRKQFSQGQNSVYEIDQLIVNGENGFLVEDVSEARLIFQTLLDNYDLCEQVSKCGRMSAIKFFGSDRATREWSEFFSCHVN
jgi:glycosyltransferase involved in cell wall biosynthesis